MARCASRSGRRSDPGPSGGVDSSVVAALLHKAIGDQLTCVFVDTGLLRWQEGDQVMAMFAEHMGVKVIPRERRRPLPAKLAGSDPEAKRKIIAIVRRDLRRGIGQNADGAGAGHHLSRT